MLQHKQCTWQQRQYFYVPLLTLSNQDKIIVLKSGSKRTMNWNKYQISDLSL